MSLNLRLRLIDISGEDINDRCLSKSDQSLNQQLKWESETREKVIYQTRESVTKKNRFQQFREQRDLAVGLLVTSSF